MKKMLSILLFGVFVFLAGCQAEQASETATSLAPLIMQTVPQQTQAQLETEPEEGNLIEMPGRVYEVPWQLCSVTEDGVYDFTDSTIPVYRYDQQELDGALAALDAYIQKNYLNPDNAVRYSEVIGIAMDSIASSQLVDPNNRSELGGSVDTWAQENYYAHYLDFDVCLCYTSGFGPAEVHVYNISLYRDDATDPGNWRVRQASRSVWEDAYTDLDEDGNIRLEPYRPLSLEEIEGLGDLGGQVLFAAEMLYQENTTWAYVYKEDTDEIIRVEIAYSNISQFIDPAQ